MPDIALQQEADMLRHLLHENIETLLIDLLGQAAASSFPEGKVLELVKQAYGDALDVI